MILILSPNIDQQGAEYGQLIGFLDQLPNIQYRMHHEQGVQQRLTEVYLIGDTAALGLDYMKSLPYAGMMSHRWKPDRTELLSGRV
ncbi:MAG: hypothetical protein HZA59_07100 [Hydrogenophilales bacterium]|nr:hypothetical protein [Hydrogenophilales bacterium]